MSDTIEPVPQGAPVRPRIVRVTTTWKNPPSRTEPETMMLTEGERHCLLHGPTGAGKSRWAEAALLALTGGIDGIVGKTDVRAPALLWRGKGHDARVLMSEVEDDLGRVWRYVQAKAGAKGGHAVALGPDGAPVPVIVARDTRGMLRGGGKTAARWLADRLHADPAAVWDAAAKALSETASPEDAEAALANVENAIRDALDENAPEEHAGFAGAIATLAQEATAAATAMEASRATATAFAAATEPPPTQAEIDAAEEAVKEAATRLARARANDHAAAEVRVLLARLKAIEDDGADGAAIDEAKLASRRGDAVAAQRIADVIEHWLGKPAGRPDLKGNVPCPCCTTPLPARYLTDIGASFAAFAADETDALADAERALARADEIRTIKDRGMRLVEALDPADSGPVLDGTYHEKTPNAGALLHEAQSALAVLEGRATGKQGPTIASDLFAAAERRAKIAALARTALTTAVHDVVGGALADCTAEAQRWAPPQGGALSLGLGKASVSYGLSPVAGGLPSTGQEQMALVALTIALTGDAPDDALLLLTAEDCDMDSATLRAWTETLAPWTGGGVWLTTTTPAEPTPGWHVAPIGALSPPPPTPPKAKRTRKAKETPPSETTQAEPTMQTETATALSPTLAPDEVAAKWRQDAKGPPFDRGVVDILALFAQRGVSSLLYTEIRDALPARDIGLLVSVNPTYLRAVTGPTGVAIEPAPPFGPILVGVLHGGTATTTPTTTPTTPEHDEGPPESDDLGARLLSIIAGLGGEPSQREVFAVLFPGGLRDRKAVEEAGRNLRAMCDLGWLDPRVGTGTVGPTVFYTLTDAGHAQIPPPPPAAPVDEAQPLLPLGIAASPPPEGAPPPLGLDPVAAGEARRRMLAAPLEGTPRRSRGAPTWEKGPSPEAADLPTEHDLPLTEEEEAF